MAYQETLVTDTLDGGRQKINANFGELYALGIVSINSADSLDATALGKIHVLSGTSADYTVDLPTAVGNEGVIIFKGAAALTKVVTIAGSSGQTIDGESDRKIAACGMIAVMSDGANWVVVNEVGSWIPYTPVFAGFSVDPTIVRCDYMRIGKICHVRILTGTSGTSNATTTTVTLPFNAAEVGHGVCTAVINNGTAQTTPGVIASTAGSTTANVWRNNDFGSTAWTASGGKRFSAFITYRVA